MITYVYLIGLSWYAPERFRGCSTKMKVSLRSKLDQHEQPGHKFHPGTTTLWTQIFHVMLKREYSQDNSSRISMKLKMCLFFATKNTGKEN